MSSLRWMIVDIDAILFSSCFQEEIRSSLVLSMLQQMLDDKVEIVREAAIKSLGLVFSLIEDTDKYNQVCVSRLICQARRCVGP